MKIKKLTEKTVEVTLEINSFYTKNPKERKRYDNFYIIKEYEKKHPKDTVLSVLQGCELDNFTKTGKFTGVWVLELDRPIDKKPAQTAPKKRSRKQKVSTK